MSGGTEITFLVAVAAGLLSFLSPCVLPLVPAYIGQLTAVAVASSEAGIPPSRWTALRHATAFVLGFGVVFGTLGLTATFAAGPLVDYIPILRQIGALLLIYLGLSLAGFVKAPFLERTWRPLDAGASASVAQATGSVALAPAGNQGPGTADRLGSWLVSSRGGLLSSFGIGAIFAVGWTPCIGVILGGILGLAATAGTQLQGAFLLAGYVLGLGIPFLVLGVLYDRAPAITRPLVRHGRIVSVVGGMLVVAIGLAMLFDWLTLIPRYFSFNTAI